MGLFEIFMPEVAEASHLRNISEQIELGNQRRSSDTNAISKNAEAVAAELQALREENGLMSLLVMALIRKLCEYTPTTIEEIKALLFELDAADGTVDGKIDMAEVKKIFGIPDPAPQEKEKDICGSCDRPLPKDRARCLYCGWSK